METLPTTSLHASIQTLTDTQKAVLHRIDQLSTELEHAQQDPLHDLGEYALKLSSSRDRIAHVAATLQNLHERLERIE